MKWIAPFLLLSACWLPGPADLVAGANVELVLSGVQAGDRVTVSLAGRTTLAVVVESGSVSLFDTLPRGEYEAVLLHDRGGVERCGQIEVEVEEELEVVALDVDALRLCDELAERTFTRLSETVRDCVDEDCEEIETRVDLDGRVRVEELEVEGEVDADLLARVFALSLGPQADRLFAGADPSCPPIDDEPEEYVELEREFLVSFGGLEVETTERILFVSCPGVAAELRELLDEARDFIP